MALAVIKGQEMNCRLLHLLLFGYYWEKKVEIYKRKFKLFLPVKLRKILLLLCIYIWIIFHLICFLFDLVLSLP